MAMNAFASSEDTVIVRPSGVLQTMSSRRFAMCLCTLCPAPYFEMYLAT